MTDSSPTNPVEAFWQRFVEWCRLQGEPEPEQHSTWAFGNSAEVAERLGQLVLDGKKTATASLAWGYEQDGESMPEVGGFGLIVDGTGAPLCVVRTTVVDVVPFRDVEEAHAYLEGEGDRSLDDWREVHWRFFERECEALGLEPQPDMPVVCERFELVYHAETDRT